MTKSPPHAICVTLFAIFVSTPAICVALFAIFVSATCDLRDTIRN